MKTQSKEFAPAIQPARLDSDSAARHLGFQPHDIPILVRAGLLKPLGHPPANAVKYFALVTLEKLRHEIQWLNKATDAVDRNWQEKKAHKWSRKNGQLN